MSFKRASTGTEHLDGARGTDAGDLAAERASRGEALDVDVEVKATEEDATNKGTKRKRASRSSAL